MLIKQLTILFCFASLLVGCKRDTCANRNKEVHLQLNPASYSKIPYKDYDTIVLKLESTNDTVFFFADKWTTDEEPYTEDPCDGITLRQYRRLTFTSWGCRRESLNGMSLEIRHYINKVSNQEMMAINFRMGYYEFPINSIGNNSQADSVTIQNVKYGNINFIQDQNITPYPFGCFYSVKYGILKMHFIDWGWPVPEGGEPWELIRK